MAQCPQCQGEYTPDHYFCNNCGYPLPDDAGQTKVLPVRNVIISEGVPNPAKYCAEGEKLTGDRILYQCPECNKVPLCGLHFNQVHQMCYPCSEWAAQRHPSVS